jgi:hypothetical protein
MAMRASETARVKKRLQEMLKKKKKDSLKDKIKKKLKDKKKTKSTKTGLLSKAGLMPVSTPGGIPKVMSQKTAQKDLKPKRRPIPGKPEDRMPRPPKKPKFPETFLRPQNPPRKFIPMKDGIGARMLREERRLSGNVKKAKPKAMADGGALAKKMKPKGRINKDDLARASNMVGSMLKNIKKNPGTVGMNKKIMDLAKKLKPTGRLSTTDLARARAALQKAFKEDRDKLKMRLKGQKPVLKTGTKEKVKGLTQKADKVKLTPAQLKKIKGLQDKFLGKMTKRSKGMIPLMGTAAKGMRKGFGGKNMRSAVKKMKRIM